MAVKIQAVTGMRDILPDESPLWQKAETVLRNTVSSFGYSEVRMPIVEATGLFVRSIGEVTDVVEKEMYTFDDNGESLSLRPEGTAGCVRSCVEHGIIHNQERRLWYVGPMFRHERPQKGRYRQFHQFGVEVFGIADADIDAELLIMISSFWKQLGISDRLSLQLNSLGSSEERAAYKEKLVQFLEAHESRLDDDCRRRMRTNPLRVLDTKNPDIQELLKDAPVLSEFFGEETKAHFSRLMAILDAAGIEYEINDRLVRGLDYYNYTVFEWVTADLGAQGTVCGGGRYDGLVEQLGAQPSPAVGFAVGLERLVLLLEAAGNAKEEKSADVYVCAMGSEASIKAQIIASDLRNSLPGVRVMVNCSGGNFKKQFRRADRSGAAYAVILGDDELASGSAGLKNLREETEQKNVSLSALAGELGILLGVKQNG